MNPVQVILIVCLLLGHSAALPQGAHAEGSIGDTVDCTDVSVHYTDDPSLTREERLRLMDKAFVESLNRFELCQAAKNKQARTSMDGGAAGGQNGGTDDGSSGREKSTAKDTGEGQGNPVAGAAAAGSVASATMSGSETPKDLLPADTVQAQASGEKQGGQEVAATGNNAQGGMTLANGKLPEDIPPAGNDDALAAQIRYAAENEPDPAKSKQLWNEYRKYKGMAPQN